MENQDKKRELIIEAALKRFAHFGLAKTTMTEIASDISLSKALLYYYFPDKISLYTAVMDHIISEIEGKMKTELPKIKSGTKAVLYFLEKRQQFVRKYYNLWEINKITGPSFPPNVMEIFRRALASEQRTITSILTKAKKSGEFKLKDPELAAELLLSALFGVRASVRVLQQDLFPSKEQFELILEKEKQLAEIFLKGLSK